MKRELRKSAIAAYVKSAGIVTDLVQKSLLDTPEAKPVFKPIGSVGPGTTVMCPQNPVKPDGSVDVIVQIRGIAGGDTKSVSSMGANAVVITAEAGGIGSKENSVAFGNSGFVNSAVSNVLAQLKARFPDKNVHLGKLTISSFSGGGSATAALLINRTQLPKGTEPPKFVFIDGLHIDPKSKEMQSLVDYANQVKNDPSAGQIEIVHTAVVPGGYASTTQVADHILSQTGLQRQKVTDWKGSGPPPVSQAQSGGLKVVQLYDQKDPYMAKDESGKVRPNVPGTAGWQHIQALQWGLQNAVS